MFFTVRNFRKILKFEFGNPRSGLGIAWIRSRATRNRPIDDNPAVRFCIDEAERVKNSRARKVEDSRCDEKNGAQISHPWREWVGLMENLVENGYFDEVGNPFAKNGVLGHKEAKSIRTACLKFARDREQLVRYLPRKDIVVIAECGCPSTDRKVVNSGKRLRAHVQVEEEDVCRSCALRGDCDRAYVKAHEDEDGRTIDVMRILLTYGLDPVVGSVENKACLNKRVQESVRSLLKAMVDFRADAHEPEPEPPMSEGGCEDHLASSPMKKGDWICPKCSFQNFARNMKCLRCNHVFLDRLKKLSLDQQDLPLKKGDWMCEKCNFLNFARNTRCFQCKEKPPKRYLILGEWECDSCNYINFRRNMLCLKCDHPRPIASKMDKHLNMSPKQQQQPWFPQRKQKISSVPRRDPRTMEFVENECSSSSPNHHQLRGFMEFPVAGGQSDFSENIKKQQLWRMRMDDGTETFHSANEEGASRCKYPNFLDNNDEDDMTGWFIASKTT